MLKNILPSYAQISSPHPSITLHFGSQSLNAELARTNSEHEIGLMFRKKLAPNSGMLFIFESDDSRCMWMKNTEIPLSVAFIDVQGKIINIIDMTPHSLTPQCSLRAARYALEMESGWFHIHKIRGGAVLTDLPKSNSDKR